MIKRSLPLLLIIMPFISKAQVPLQLTKVGKEVKFGENPINFLVEEHDGKVYAVGADRSGLHLIYPYKDVHIEVFDSETLNLITVYTIEKFKYDGKKTTLKEVFGNDSGLHLLYEAADKKKDLVNLIHVKVSRQGEIGSPKKVAEIDEVERFGAQYYIYHSDENKTTLVYEEAFKTRETVRTPEVTLLDSELNKIWSGRLQTPFVDRYFKPVQAEVSEAGELFVMGFATEDEEQEDHLARKTSAYGIVRVSKKGEPITYNFEAKGKTIHSLAIKPDYRGQLLVTGFYSEEEEEEEGVVRGSLYGVLDQSSLKEEKINMKEFNDEVFDYLQTDDESSIGEKLATFFSPEYSPAFQGLDHMYYQNFAEHPNGGVVVIAERQYASGDIRNLEKRTGFLHYDEIAAFHFDENGKLNWMKIIPKSQVVTSELMASYFFHDNEDGLYFFFNDNPDNINLREAGEPIKPLNGRLEFIKADAVCVKLSWAGSATYGLLSGRNGDGIKLYPDLLIESANKTLITVEPSGFKYFLERYSLN